MVNMANYDLIIIGGGIIGCATALAIGSREPNLKVLLVEKESQLASHQTGHNSGVIHAGLYYRPGSLKAMTCTSGREKLYQFCEEQQIPHKRCGKIVVATDEHELPVLEELGKRGKDNGLLGLEKLDSADLKKFEPHVHGIAGLYVPQTGIVNYRQVTEAMAQVFTKRGGTIQFDTAINEIQIKPGGYRLISSQGTFEARSIVNCAGLQSDRIARLAGLKPQLKIIPFRGEYYQLTNASRHYVKNLIYPVPNPQMPFLGVHFTRMIEGTVEAGPNAVLAFKREGYRRSDFSLVDLLETVTFPGFWKLSSRFWRQGMEEYKRSFFKSHFVKDLQRLIPEVQAKDLTPCHSGVRAQAVDIHGNLMDDFHFLCSGKMIHVLNAPSPAATASLRIGEVIAEQYFKSHSE